MQKLLTQYINDLQKIMRKNFHVLVNIAKSDVSISFKVLLCSTQANLCISSKQNIYFYCDSKFLKLDF